MGAALACAALATSAPARANTAPIKPWAGKGTPALALEDVAGRAVDLRKMRGQVVLVNFWATWCEPCRDEMPGLERLRARLQGKAFEVLAVNYGESGPKVAAFLEREKLTLPVLMDPEKKAADRWNAKGLPMTFLVDARGRVRYWVFGERDWSEGEAFGYVEKLVAEGAVARR